MKLLEQFYFAASTLSFDISLVEIFQLYNCYCFFCFGNNQLLSTLTTPPNSERQSDKKVKAQMTILNPFK